MHELSSLAFFPLAYFSFVSVFVHVFMLVCHQFHADLLFRQ